MPANIACLLEESARRWADKPVLISDDSTIDWACFEARAGD